ncbi:MAG: hypothetical protein U0271_43315 [Polyangiaceae bacterium]
MSFPRLTLIALALSGAAFVGCNSLTEPSGTPEIRKEQRPLDKAPAGNGPSTAAPGANMNAPQQPGNQKQPIQPMQLMNGEGKKGSPVPVKLNPTPAPDANAGSCGG